MNSNQNMVSYMMDINLRNIIGNFFLFTGLLKKEIGNLWFYIERL